jgi:hypothetical protein
MRLYCLQCAVAAAAESGTFLGSRAILDMAGAFEAWVTEREAGNDTHGPQARSRPAFIEPLPPMGGA